MSEQEIYQKFIEQEKKKEWTCYKNAAIQNVIEKYEITHGKGKYKSIPPWNASLVMSLDSIVFSTLFILVVRSKILYF